MADAGMSKAPTGHFMADMGTLLGIDPESSNVHNLLKLVFGAVGGSAAGDMSSIGSLVNGKPFSAAQAPAATAPAPIGSLFGGAPGATPAGPDINTLMSAIWQQESGGRAGVVGPDTQYGNAKGVGQVLDTTGEATAKAHGIAWKPQLMTAKTPEGLAYQQQISSLVLQDNLTNVGGNVPAAIALYHAGSPQGVGPRTQAYTQQVLDRLGFASPAGTAPFQQPGVAFVDPQAAMNMIPDPQKLAHIALPNAPQLQAPPDAPQYEQADVQALLGPLAAASAPVAPPAPGKWDMLQSILAGAAGGAAGVGPEQGLGDLILAAGTGAMGGKRAQTDKVQAQDTALKEAQRQVAMMLASQGLGLNQGNLDIRNHNLDSAYAGKVAQTGVANQNATNADARIVDELMANTQIDQTNVSNANQTNTARANLGVSALQGAAGAQNQANAGQAQLSTDVAKLYMSGALSGMNSPAITSVLSKAQIDPKLLEDNKNPVMLNAKEVAQNVASKNDSLALGGLATELVLNGSFAEVLGDGDAKKVQQAIQQKNIAGAAQIIASSLTSAMADPKARGTLIQIIDQLAASGNSPAAQIISRNLTRGQTPTAGQQPKP